MNRTTAAGSWAVDDDINLDNTPPSSKPRNQSNFGLSRNKNPLGLQPTPTQSVFGFNNAGANINNNKYARTVMNQDKLPTKIVPGKSLSTNQRENKHNPGNNNTVFTEHVLDVQIDNITKLSIPKNHPAREDDIENVDDWKDKQNQPLSKTQVNHRKESGQLSLSRQNQRHDSLATLPGSSHNTYPKRENNMVQNQGLMQTDHSQTARQTRSTSEVSVTTSKKTLLTSSTARSTSQIVTISGTATRNSSHRRDDNGDSEWIDEESTSSKAIEVHSNYFSDKVKANTSLAAPTAKSKGKSSETILVDLVDSSDDEVIIGDSMGVSSSSTAAKEPISPQYTDKFQFDVVYFGPLQYPSPAALANLEHLQCKFFFRFKLWSEPSLEIHYVNDDVNSKLEIIPCKEIYSINYNKDADDDKYFLCLKLYSTCRLESFAVGRGRIIDPDCKTVSCSQYITLVSREYFCDDLKIIFDKMKQEGNKEIPMVRAFSKGKGLSHMFLRDEDDDETYRRKLIDECQSQKTLEEMEKSNLDDRSTRRRIAARNSAALERHDPDDGITYTIYPPAIEAMDAITICRGDLKRLKMGVYFNDSLIDLKIKYLVNNLSNEEKKNRIHAFSCLFYAKLTELRDPKAAHDLVCRWTKNINLFDLDFILFPINSSNHWSLCVVVRPGLLLQEGMKFEELFETLKGAKKPKAAAINLTDETPTKQIKGNVFNQLKEKVATCYKKDAVIDIEEEEEKQRKKDTERLTAEEAKKEAEALQNINFPCILHLDSLRMHHTNRIAKQLIYYLWYELQAKKSSASVKTEPEEQQIEMKLQETSMSSSVVDKSIHDTEEGSDISCHKPENDSSNDADEIINMHVDEDSDNNPPKHSSNKKTNKLKDEDEEFDETLPISQLAKSSHSTELDKNEEMEVFDEEKILEVNFGETPNKRTTRSQNAQKTYGRTKTPEATSSSTTKKKIQNLSEEELAFQQFFHKWQIVGCQVPKQENGYDCGVFVIRFAQMIMDKWPSSTFQDIDDKFHAHFSKEFTQDDISNERDALRILLAELRVEWENIRKDYKLKLEAEKLKLKVEDGSSSSDFPCEAGKEEKMPNKEGENFPKREHDCQLFEDNSETVDADVLMLDEDKHPLAEGSYFKEENEMDDESQEHGNRLQRQNLSANTMFDIAVNTTTPSREIPYNFNRSPQVSAKSIDNRQTINAQFSLATPEVVCNLIDIPSRQPENSIISPKTFYSSSDKKGFSLSLPKESADSIATGTSAAKRKYDEIFNADNENIAPPKSDLSPPTTKLNVTAVRPKKVQSSKPSPQAPTTNFLSPQKPASTGKIPTSESIVRANQESIVTNLVEDEEVESEETKLEAELNSSCFVQTTITLDSSDDEKEKDHHPIDSIDTELQEGSDRKRHCSAFYASQTSSTSSSVGVYQHLPRSHLDSTTSNHSIEKDVDAVFKEPSSKPFETIQSPIVVYSCGKHAHDSMYKNIGEHAATSTDMMDLNNVGEIAETPMPTSYSGSKSKRKANNNLANFMHSDYQQSEQ